MIKVKELKENLAPLTVAVGVVAANVDDCSFEMNEKNWHRS